MKSLGTAFLFCLLFLPTIVFAGCAVEGNTVIFVNGILTTEREAQDNTDLLRIKFESKTGRTDVKFINGYNESHLNGAGDFLQSIAQTFNSSVSDFDRNTILLQIYPQVTTRKILLVGHSQGTFYANALHQYLLENGVPESSIAVYNLATPASYVAGGGKYLTSANDKAIAKIRELDAAAGAREPLPANILIPLPADEINDSWGGHHFASDYLSGAGERIVSDISAALLKLKATDSSNTDGCFVPPPQTLLYKAQATTFKIADPLATNTSNAVAATTKTIVTATQKAYAAAQNVLTTLVQKLTPINVSSQGAAAASALIPPSPAPSPAPVSIKTEGIPPVPIVPTPTPVPVPQMPAVPPPTLPTQPPPPQPLPPSSVTAPDFNGSVSLGGTVPNPDVPETPLFIEFPIEGALFATTTVSINGTSTPDAVIVFVYGSNTASTTTAADGSWSTSITLSEGTVAIGAVAADTSGNTSNALTRTITVDITPPSAPSLTISECTSSLSPTSCLIIATHITLVWDSISDAVYYAYQVNQTGFATTTATSVSLTIAANATSSIDVGAYDVAGNAATSTVEVVTTSPPPTPPPPIFFQI